MANDFDNTALNATVRELWDDKIEDARYAAGVLMNRVANKSGIAQKKGDVIHVTVDQKYTVGSVGGDGSFTPQNYAPTTSDVVLNQWEQIAIRVLDRAQAQSFWTPDSKFPSAAGKAFANQYDFRIASLHTSVAAGNSVGNVSSPAQFDKTLAQEAMLRLANQNIPLEELSWCLHPVAYYNGLMNEQQLTASDASGQSKNVLTTGYLMPLFGSPVYLSTNILETGAPAVKKNLLLHKSAIAIAWQKNVDIEHVRTTANLVLADLFVAQSLYGQSVIRNDHFVVINSSAT